MYRSPSLATPKQAGRINPRVRLSAAGERAMQVEAARYGLHLSPLSIRLLRNGELYLPLGGSLALLQGYTAALEQEVRAARRAGDRRSVIRGIEAGAIRYDRADPDEVWQSWADTLRLRGGDCEDLAGATAAELRVDGPPSGLYMGGPVRARPVVYRASPRVLHVVVDTPWGICDPSRLAGMVAP